VVAVYFVAVGNATNNQSEGSCESSGEYYPPVAPYPSSESAASTTSVTGFYGGVGIGLGRLKNRVYKDNTDTRRTKSKSGLLWDIFCGYNFQFGKVIVGVEALMGMEYAKPKVFTKDSTTTDDNSTGSVESTTLKRKYSFGLVPHVGYNVFGGFNVYLNFGTTIGKYNLRFKKRTKSNVATTTSKQATSTGTTTTTTTTITTNEPVIDEKKANKSKTKASIVLGLGLEQNFGPFFVGAECNKIVGKKIGEIKEGKEKVKTGSYTFKLKGGYRF
jgi:opacity protein-like surface antigen